MHVNPQTESAQHSSAYHSSTVFQTFDALAQPPYTHDPNLLGGAGVNGNGMPLAQQYFSFPQYQWQDQAISGTTVAGTSTHIYNNAPTLSDANLTPVFVTECAKPPGNALTPEPSSWNLPAKCSSSQMATFAPTVAEQPRRALFLPPSDDEAEGVFESCR